MIKTRKQIRWFIYSDQIWNSEILKIGKFWMRNAEKLKPPCLFVWHSLYSRHKRRKTINATNPSKVKFSLMVSSGGSISTFQPGLVDCLMFLKWICSQLRRIFVLIFTETNYRDKKEPTILCTSDPIWRWI